MNHVEDEGIADMFEWDERVAFAENATMIGRVGATKQGDFQLDGLPKEYWQYKDLFTDKKAEMLAPRRTFDLLGVTYTVTYGNRLDLLITLVRSRSDVCLGRLV